MTEDRAAMRVLRELRKFGSRKWKEMWTITSKASYREMRDIVIGKLVDRTIDDDYEELSERLFGEGNCFNSSEVRKRMYGMKAIIEAIDRDGEMSIADEDTLNDLYVK